MSDEVVVYDLDTDKAHLLGSTTAAVWRLCDGTNTVAQIAAQLPPHVASGGTEFVWIALRELDDASLLEEPVVEPESLAGVSRRVLLKRLGLAAAALPVVTTILAPTAAAAATACSTDAQCTSPQICCNGTCVAAGSVTSGNPCTQSTCCAAAAPCCRTTNTCGANQGLGVDTACTRSCQCTSNCCRSGLNVCKNGGGSCLP